MRGTETNEVILLSENSLISFLTFRTTLFSSIIKNFKLLYCKRLCKIKIIYTKCGCKFFAFSIMIFRVSISTSVTLFVNLIKNITIFIMICIVLETNRFIYSTFEIRTIIFIIETLFTFITL